MTELAKNVLAYGTWPSSLSAEAVTSSSSTFGVMCEYQSTFLATESRPTEAGRVALVRRLAGGAVTDVLPKEYSVRTRVHEYGGRSWWPGQSSLYFCEWSDQRLYRCTGNITQAQDPKPLTPEPLTKHALRFADGVETPDGRWVIAVAEIHGEEKLRLRVSNSVDQEPVNAVVAIPTDGSAANDVSAVCVLCAEADFVSNPRVSQDGQWLCWLQWYHPNMPWDNTELMVARLDTTEQKPVSVSGSQRIAGEHAESIVGPQWVSDGRLVFSSDRSGWWNLMSACVQSGDVLALTSLNDSEVGAPAWAIGTTRFIELCGTDANALDAPWLAVAVTKQASDSISLLSRSGELLSLPLTCAAVRGLTATHDGGLVALVELNDADSTHILFSALEVQEQRVGKSLLSCKTPKTMPFPGSIAEGVSFPSGGERSHAFYYAPVSPNYCGPADELPPLIVMGHGGPTSHATPALRMAIQFWTSRGFAVADVNYRGSSGFGRRYRQGLNEAWGVVDVEDCVNAAKYLADTGRVDGKRCVIRGGSAGGLTVLRALQLYDVFAAGTSLYGVADLEGLLAETHKFESRYLDNLIGAYPEHKQRYVERSPIHHAQDIQVPLLVLQGDEDKVVPPSQSEAIVQAVANQGLAHAYVVFKGEQHGWRQAATLIRALELELWFYGAALGFKPANGISAPTEAVGFPQ